VYSCREALAATADLALAGIEIAARFTWKLEIEP